MKPRSCCVFNAVWQLIITRLLRNRVVSLILSAAFDRIPSSLARAWASYEQSPTGVALAVNVCTTVVDAGQPSSSSHPPNYDDAAAVFLVKYTLCCTAQPCTPHARTTYLVFRLPAIIFSVFCPRDRGW